MPIPSGVARKVLLTAMTVTVAFASNKQIDAGIVDFETVPGSSPVDGLAITNQYAGTQGMTFSSSGSDFVLASEGGDTQQAFSGYDFSIDTLAPGQMGGGFFLTDDLNGSAALPPSLTIEFDQLASFASGLIFDIAREESWRISAIGEYGSTLEFIDIQAGDVGTGDTLSTAWSFTRGFDIKRIRIDYTNPNVLPGFGFDNFEASMMTPVPEPGSIVLLSAMGLLTVVRKRRNRNQIQ